MRQRKRKENKSNYKCISYHSIDQLFGLGPAPSSGITNETPCLARDAQLPSLSGSLSCYDLHLHQHTPAQATVRQITDGLLSAWQRLREKPTAGKQLPVCTNPVGPGGLPGQSLDCPQPAAISTKGRFRHETQQPLAEGEDQL